jgi:hypothetical protein
MGPVFLIVIGPARREFPTIRLGKFSLYAENRDARNFARQAEKVARRVQKDGQKSVKSALKTASRVVPDGIRLTRSRKAKSLPDRIAEIVR